MLQRKREGEEGESVERREREREIERGVQRRVREQRQMDLTIV
jgi:hypothetical protein